jgi:hypothetical protein
MKQRKQYTTVELPITVLSRLFKSFLSLMTCKYVSKYVEQKCSRVIYLVVGEVTQNGTHSRRSRASNIRFHIAYRKAGFVPVDDAKKERT